MTFSIRKFIIGILVFLLFIKLFMSEVNYDFIENGDKNGQGNNSMKIISYNVQYLPYMTKDLTKLGKIIQEYDIVLLQELFTNMKLNKKYYFLKEMHNLGFNIVAKTGPSLNEMKFMDSGLAILTKYPVLDKGFIGFKDGEGIDGLSNKGILWAKLLVNGQELIVYNVHLQASYVLDKYYIEPVKMRQLEQLKEACCYFKPKPCANIIIGGDFNIDLEHEKTEQMVKRFFYDLDLQRPDESTCYCIHDKNWKVTNTCCVDGPNHISSIRDFFLTKGVTLVPESSIGSTETLATSDKVKTHPFNEYSDHTAITMETKIDYPLLLN